MLVNNVTTIKYKIGGGGGGGGRNHVKVMLKHLF